MGSLYAAPASNLYHFFNRPEWIEMTSHRTT